MNKKRDKKTATDLLVAEKLKELYQKNHITQKELGEVFDFPAIKVNEQLNGAANISLEELKGYAEYFKVPIEYFFGDLSYNEGRSFKQDMSFLYNLMEAFGGQSREVFYYDELGYKKSTTAITFDRGIFLSDCSKKFNDLAKTRKALENAVGKNMFSKLIDNAINEIYLSLKEDIKNDSKSKKEIINELYNAYPTEFAERKYLLAAPVVVDDEDYITEDFEDTNNMYIDDNE